ncbi:glutamate racemase [Roseburia hominis]
MKIGIFDSGIGGLSVLHLARKMMPHAEFVYYADEKHVPYGEKTVEAIRGFVEEILYFLIEQKVDAIVIACNTATSVANKEFREKFPVPIVGMEPAVKMAVEHQHEKGKRILVAATPVTIAGDKLHLLLERVDKNHEADLVSLPKLVRFAEKGDFETSEIDAYLQAELRRFDLAQYEAVVLGCTHFNYFKENFRRVFPVTVHFVDGNEGTIRQLMRVLGQVDAQEEEARVRKITYYFSGIPVTEAERKKVEEYLHQLDKMAEIS